MVCSAFAFKSSVYFHVFVAIRSRVCVLLQGSNERDNSGERIVVHHRCNELLSFHSNDVVSAQCTAAGTT